MRLPFTTLGLIICSLLWSNDDYVQLARCDSSKRFQTKSRQYKQKWRLDLSQAEAVSRPTSIRADLQKSQALLKAYLKERKTDAPLLAASQLQRGIVITAGGQNLLTNALVVLKVIRDGLNSTLPVEVFYFGEREYDAQIVASLEALPGVAVLDASISPQPAYLPSWPAELHGYAKKVFSLFSSSFAEVLLLDADCQPLRQPEALFELPAYKEHGNVFWADYWTANSAPEAPKAEAYRLLELPVPWQGKPGWASVESGQLLFNRELHAESLAWTMWINLWSDILYELVLGDKDTFEMGFMLSGQHDAFYRMPDPPRAAFTKANQAGWHLHVGMVHTVDGHPVTLHRTSGGKFDGGKSADQQPRAEYFTELMTVGMAKQYTWHVKLAINVLRTSRVETEISCHTMTAVTHQALQNVYRSGQFDISYSEQLARLVACTNPSNRREVITMMPVPLFGKHVANVIDYSYKFFQQLKT